MSRHPKSKQVKQELFLKCGKVDMYSMQKYAKEDLQLHHDPSFRKTQHTVYEESFLLAEENHRALHRIELDDKEEYERRMVVIREHKKILEKKKIGSDKNG